MFAWIAENALTLIVIFILLALCGLAVYVLIKDKKNAKGGCTGNCATCGMGCSHSYKTK
ncbi:MAG: FeoB-associated Cys-rich membrane protein [Clostridia bacterium]|nr:FeoB-associated Cys-rich membrane protein [Clostridia bacterium]